MVTVSQIVKRMIDSRPMIQEALIEGIVSFGNLAEKLKKEIEFELGEPVQKSAVMMAIRRYAEHLEKKTFRKIPFKPYPEIIMKTNLCDICIVKTPSALEKIRKIHKIVNYERGDTLNIIQGNYEITVVISQKYLSELKEIMENEKILNIEKKFSFSDSEPDRGVFYTPGGISIATRKLSWENINIYLQ